MLYDNLEHSPYMKPDKKLWAMLRGHRIEPPCEDLASRIIRQAALLPGTYRARRKRRIFIQARSKKPGARSPLDRRSHQGLF
jgi:hypothetical protein